MEFSEYTQELHFDIGQPKNIFTTGVKQYATRGLLPNVGNTEYLYYIQNEHALYMWDKEKLQYICCGRDYQEIDLIDCGDSTAEV